MSGDPWHSKRPWLFAILCAIFLMLLYGYKGFDYAGFGLLGMACILAAVYARKMIPSKIGVAKAVPLVTGRQPELTALRGITSLWVVVYHTNILLVKAPFLPLISAGYLGVSVFFILSICLLLRSLDNNPDLKHYFTRRVKRIWPMYFATVVMVFFFEAHNITWLAEQMSFTTVFYDNIGIKYVFWSLQVEEFAYLFFPLIYKLSVSQKYALGVALYFTGVVSAVFVLNGFNSSTVFQWWWLPPSLSAYGLGILVYLRKLSAVLLPLALLGAVFWDNNILATLSCIVTPAFAYMVQEAHRFKVLRNGFLIKVGDISYGLYLIHFLLISAIGWIGLALCLPAAWLFEKANAVGIKAIGSWRPRR